MLTEDGPVPAAPFDGYEVLLPARDYRNRHASILLALDATVEADGRGRAARLRLILRASPPSDPRKKTAARPGGSAAEVACLGDPDRGRHPGGLGTVSCASTLGTGCGRAAVRPQAERSQTEAGQMQPDEKQRHKGGGAGKSWASVG